MSGETAKKARASAERCIPQGIEHRSARFFAFVDGYMAGHAAHTRAMNKRYLPCTRCGHSLHFKGTNGCNCGCHFEVTS